MDNSTWSVSLHGGAEIQGRLTRLRLSYVEAGEILAKSMMMDIRDKTTRVTGAAQDGFVVNPGGNVMSWRIDNTSDHGAPNVYGNAVGKRPWPTASGDRTILQGGRVYSRANIQTAPIGTTPDTLYDVDKMKEDFVRIYRQINKLTPKKRTSLYTASKKGWI